MGGGFERNIAGRIRFRRNGVSVYVLSPPPSRPCSYKIIMPNPVCRWRGRRINLYVDSGFVAATRRSLENNRCAWVRDFRSPLAFRERARRGHLNRLQIYTRMESIVFLSSKKRTKKKYLNNKTVHVLHANCIPFPGRIKASVSTAKPTEFKGIQAKCSPRVIDGIREWQIFGQI